MCTSLTIATLLAALTVSSLSFAEEPTKHKWVGLDLNVGAPEGVGVGVVVSPYYDWLKLTGSYTNNYFASGGRLGLTLDPIKFGVAPTFTTEYGFTGHFNAGKVVNENLPDASYQYVNLQPGLEFGSRNGFRFYIRGGLTHLWADTYNFNSVITTEGVSASNPHATFWLAPTFKIGASILLF
jgi:hypothetical protein